MNATTVEPGIMQDDKVTPDHLKRKAYLYIRQSTLRQVRENTESAYRQYDLKRRALQLGWCEEHIVTIDCDQGKSGTSADQRLGFQSLVAEVGMGRVGIVMSLCASRLARKCSDWHRLLELCALSDTLLLDEYGVYDLTRFNDSALLGLKGTISELEHRMIRARLMGGLESKARRGELPVRISVGYVRDAHKKLVLNPDKQVQESIRLLFSTFERVGSTFRTVKFFREEGLLFPKRLHAGPNKGDTIWRELSISRVNELLHNPIYAGVYCYGRRKQAIRPTDGKRTTRYLPREKWLAFIPEAHAGYLSLDKFEENQRRLAENVRAKPECWRTPPREGPALLQGIVICGVCGRHMTVRYHDRKGLLKPEYHCAGPGERFSLPQCQSIPGGAIDEAVGKLLLEIVQPVHLEVALAVQQELESRTEEADRLRRRKVERLQYESDLARRRFMQVDPHNRLVADELESAWNGCLKELRQAKDEYDRDKEADTLKLDNEKKLRIRELASDFPRLWSDPHTPDRERKRLVRLLIEDVTLVKNGNLKVQVRFRGGATRTIELPRPSTIFEKSKTSPAVLDLIDTRLDTCTEGEIAAELNRQGLRSGCARSFDGRRVRNIRRRFGLKSRAKRLRENGWLTLNELAKKLGLTKGTIKLKRAKGQLGLQSIRLNDMGQYLYQDPDGLKKPKKFPNPSTCAQ
ncbi:MAG: recombinase family protein, partial [Planctomycetes bacterium]|nr:recombinase family protein [Planctomycetota bacterium]